MEFNSGFKGLKGTEYDGVDRRHWALDFGNGAVCVSHTAGN